MPRSTPDTYSASVITPIAAASPAIPEAIRRVRGPTPPRLMPRRAKPVRASERAVLGCIRARPGKMPLRTGTWNSQPSKTTMPTPIPNDPARLVSV